MSKPIQHLAIIRLSAMGDVAMTVPVIRALVEQHPKLKVTMVSRPFFKPFFDQIPNLTFFEIDLKKRHKGFLGLLRLFFDLKKLNIDAVADLHHVLRSKIIRNLMAFCGKKVAFTNKQRREKKALTRTQNKVFKPLKSMFQQHADTFAKLGFLIDLSRAIYPKKPLLSDEILTLSGNKKNQKWIGIAPFAQYKPKIYPLDLMQNVIDELASNTNHKIFLFGGKNREIEMLNSFAEIGRAHV